MIRNLWILRRDLLKEIKEGKTQRNQAQTKNATENRRKEQTIIQQDLLPINSPQSE